MKNRSRMPKTPNRPTPAPGVPVPTAYTGPSRNLQAMSASIGQNRALAEFYKALVGEQWEYDNDYRQSVFDQQRDMLRHDQEISVQNNREWLKSGSSGLGTPASSYTRIGEDGKTSKTEQLAKSRPGASINAFESGNSDMSYEAGREIGKSALEEYKETAAKTKTQEAAEKKAERDEEEADWWGKAVGAVGGALDAVTPDAVTDRVAEGGKAWADSSHGGAILDAGGFALKQLSRTGHATASAAKAWNEMDDDTGNVSLPGPLGTLGNLFGQSSVESIDDLNWEGIKNVGSEFMKGLKLENDTTFSDVIQRNAEFNPDRTIHDNFNYQMLAGIGGDIVIDPLNLVGVGVITKPVRIAKENKRIKNIESLADDIAGMNVPKKPRTILQANDTATYTADDVIDMLGGRKKYTNRTEAIKDSKRIGNNVNVLSKAIDEAVPSSSKSQAIHKAGARVRAQLDAERARYASEVVTEGAVARTAKAETTGNLPVGSAKALTRRIEQHRVVRALGASKYGKDPDKFDEALGSAWTDHPALSKADRKELLEKNRYLTKKAYPVESNRNAALWNQVKQAKELVKKNPTQENKALVSRLQVALDRDNKKFNRLRADTFMRSTRARINKNLGTNSKRERELDAIAKQANDELERTVGTSTLSGDASTHTLSMDEANPGLMQDGTYLGTSDDMIAEAKVERVEGEYPEVSLDNPEAAFTPDLANFHNREQQLKAILAAVDNERGKLYPDVVDEAVLDQPLMGVPEAIQTPFGDIDPTKIQENLVLNNDSMQVTVREGVSPAARDWLEDFAEAFNDQWADEFSRLNQNAQRGANEVAQRKGIAEVTGEHIAGLVKLGDEDAKHFTEIFRNPDGSEIDLKAAAKKFAYPSFEHKGKRIFQNSKELAKMVDAPAVSRSDKMLKFIEDPSKLTEKDTAYVFDRLKEFGLPVVKHPEAIFNYLTHNGIALRDMFQPKNIAFAMHFKKKHGITLEEATELRSSILGNTVKAGKGYENTRWSRTYPKGMSKARFVHEVTGASGGTALRNVLDGAPFRISPKADELGFPSPTSRPMSNSAGGWKSLSEEDFAKALDEAGMPPESTLDDVQAQWYDDMHTYLTGLEPAKLKNKLIGIWESSHGKQVTARKKEIIERSLPNRELAAAKSRKENIAKARETAFDKVASRIEKNQQVSRVGSSIHLPDSLDELETAKSVLAAKKEEFLEQVDETREALQGAKQVHDTSEIARLERRLNRLKTAYNAEKEAIKKDLKTAREAKEQMKSRLREEAILSVANAEIIAKSRGLSFDVVGKQIPIPTTRSMFSAAERAGGLPVINKFFQVYKDSFASQAKLLPDEMLYIRNRAISDPSKNISEHIRSIKRTLGQIPLKARTASTRDYANGIDNEVTRMMDEHFTAMLPYFQNKVPVGNDTLKVWEINAYLPEHLRISSKAEVENPHQLMIKLMGDAKGKIDLKRDPVEAIWNTRIAIEQAMARKAMVHSLNETFGIKRGYTINRKNGQVVRKKGETAGETVEKLKDEGWRTVAGLGHTHYFPADTAESIARLLKMFEPKEAGKTMQFIDEVTGIWKTSVTIYNIPGYYIRNGIGEVMSAWLAGVSSTKPYYKSAQVWRYTSKELQDAEALATMKPELGLKVETKDQIGKKHAVTLQNGTVVDIAKVHGWYRDQGLATGFINTEYRHHYNRMKEKLHQVPGAQFLSNRNEGLREFNENYEDFYRMAHFIDKLGKAPKGMSNFAAAEWAAQSVRKYHFDYTDFTRAEKATMLRVFPFYKWSRKALPLMSSMLFVKPGKMMAYPKTMEGLSEGLVGSDDLDPDEEHNGFMPNYRGMVPGSIADMWSYQVAGETGYDAEGQQSYFRMQTPQMDALNGISNPGNLGESLLNPLIKGPIEQLKGETLGMGLPVANDSDSVEEEDGRLINNRWSHVMSMFPPGAIAANIDRGDMDQDALIRLLTGMGYREVSEQHRNMLKAERSD